MSAPLDELRAQRALIQQHLDWLDARIAAVEGDAPVGQPASAPVEASEGAQPEPKLAAAAPSTATATSVEQADAPSTEPAASFFDIDKDTQSSCGSDIRKAQIGCFIIFIVAILGFLFLLFGLPYLVD
jgi:uncharacterized membrane protein